MTYLDIKTAKVIILVKQNSPLIIDDIQLQQKLEYGQVLVKILVSGICGSQLGEIWSVEETSSSFTCHEGYGSEAISQS